MMNSEIATAVAARHPLLIVVADNRGYGCIHRLQGATAGTTYNNLLADSFPDATDGNRIDFVAHARSLGAVSEKAESIAALEAALTRARDSGRTTVIVVETDPQSGTTAGGAWWNVPVAEVSTDPRVRDAHAAWRKAVDAGDGG
jgi:3D-(3,5/4)-trihydroxycyclohexane-1,2-dione acylhydrolase (decyclizing)